MDGSEAHILIVDDNHLNRELLNRQLTRNGFRCSEADTGRSALDTIANEYVDLVLLDLMMPVMDGYQVLDQMSNHPAWRHIPVIVISAVDDVDSVIQCIEMGAQDYLFKPFNKTLLIARIHSTLEKKLYQDQREEMLNLLEAEREKSDRLLLNILPEPIANRLKQGEQDIADYFEDVSVLFADLVNFTPLSRQVDPTELIIILNRVFSQFDSIAADYGAEKIKTIGDSYLAVGNLLHPLPDHPTTMTLMALDMHAAVEEFAASDGYEIDLRIGIHAGPVVAGVIGNNKIFFDLWGETVNIAHRMESHGETGKIQVSNSFYNRIRSFFDCTSRGSIQIKGMGNYDTYFVNYRL